MKRKLVQREIFKDNRGSTLLLAIIAMCFIGILGSLALSLTMTNIRMKQVDYQSKTNFYGSEIVMDELKAGLEKTSSDCMYEAYNNLLLNYAKITSDPSKSLKAEFDKLYIDKLLEKLAGATATYNPTSNYSYKLSILSGYLKPTTIATIESVGVATNNLKVKLDITNVDSVNFVTLEGLKVTFLDAKGFQTTITTTIKLESPNLNFDSASIYPEYTKYALIANEQLLVESGTGMNINGNIYAGPGGLSVSGSLGIMPDPSSVLGYNLKIKGDTLITRGDITVNESSALFIGDNTNDVNIWAENIATKGNATGTMPSYLNVYGNCKVADDLMLGAKNSQVIMDGTYYGYTYKEMIPASGPDSSLNRSSAILINGLNSSLNMVNVNSMTLAGSAFISRASQSVASTASDILMGESIAVKSNQVAYLVPNEYVLCGHNPATTADIAALAGADPVDFSTALPELKNLLTTIGYAQYHYQIGGMNVVYYYLEFKDQKSANTYFSNYFANDTTNTLVSNAKSYIPDTGAGILLNGNVLLAGNALKKNALGNYELSGGVLSNPDLPHSSLVNASILTAMEYKSRQLGLVGTSASATSGDYRLSDKNSSPLFQTIMSQDNHGTPADPLDDELIIKKESDIGVTNGFINSTGSIRIKPIPIDLPGGANPDYYVYIIHNLGETFTLTNSISLNGTNYPVSQGIVVATGDIKVETDYEGLIISGGTILMQNNNRAVKSNPAIVQDIFSYALQMEKMTGAGGWYNDKTKKFTHYFKEYINESSGGNENINQVDISQYIVYENWRKNVE